MGASGVAALALALLVALPLVLHYQRRRDEELVRDTWCFRLTPAAIEEYDQFREELAGSMRPAAASYAAALVLTGTARRRMLDLAVRSILERAEPVLHEQLRLMLDVARHLAAIAPPPHLEQARFALGRTRRLAEVHRILHLFLISSHERFAFRVHVLRWARWLVLRALSGGEGRDEGGRREFAAAWQDYGVVGDETLRSYRTLLESIWAVPAADRVPRPVA